MSARPMVKGMRPCPHCGAMLDGALVAAIRDPKAEESCPRRPKPKREPATQETVAKIADLASLMMLGAQLRALHATSLRAFLDDDEESAA